MQEDTSEVNENEEERDCEVGTCEGEKGGNVDGDTSTQFPEDVGPVAEHPFCEGCDLNTNDDESDKCSDDVCAEREKAWMKETNSVKIVTAEEQVDVAQTAENAEHAIALVVESMNAFTDIVYNIVEKSDFTQLSAMQAHTDGLCNFTHNIASFVLVKAFTEAKTKEEVLTLMRELCTQNIAMVSEAIAPSEATTQPDGVASTTV